jgi:hypothetical protein
MKTTKIGLFASSFILAIGAQAGVLFTNLGSGGSYSLTGSYGVGLNFDGAVQFTPSASGAFSRALIPLGILFQPGHDDGWDQVTVYLQADASGLPSGVNLDSISVTGLTAWPGSSLVTATSTSNPWLTAGTPYWLVLDETHPYTTVPWMLNTTGDFGAPTVVMGGSSSGPWFPEYLGVERPAFQIEATTPEPASILMLGLGLAVLGITGRFRRSR